MKRIGLALSASVLLATLTACSQTGAAAAAPEFSLDSGYYASSQSVTIESATTGATIRYTTDGSTPTETTGTVYGAPITVASTSLIRAVASMPGLATSGVASADYYVATTTLSATIRDFSSTHVDFENLIGDDRGITAGFLNADHAPVYGDHPSGTTTTISATSFGQWYADISGVNAPLVRSFDLTETTAGTFEYANTSFFPIDDEGLGNESNLHNYHFTTEIHTGIYYGGDAEISVAGNDDIFVFVNGRLAIDLGGVHSAETQSVTLDAAAAAVYDLSAGHAYHVDVFSAQRHTSNSALTITITGKPIDLPY